MEQLLRKVKFVDMAAQHAEIKQELLGAISRVIDRGDFVLGQEAERFEAEFAALISVRYAVAVHSGTDALILALRALGIGAGDEVITVPNSFIASTACISLVGARPVFVDVQSDLNIDPTLIEAALTPKTKAILPVHLTGRAADMDKILKIAARHGLYVIEDSAQAVLAEYKGRRVGALGQIGCFSLHPLKTLNACGDGGVLTTNDPEIAERLRVLRNLGLKSRDECVVWSGHSRLDTLQAAILLVKLKYLTGWTEKRRAHAKRYQQTLSRIKEVVLPSDSPDCKSVYHVFVIRAKRRDELKQHLSQEGIETAIHYPVPVHLSPAAKLLGYRSGDFPAAEAQAKEILSLPVHQDLTSQDVDYVCQTIKAFYGA